VKAERAAKHAGLAAPTAAVARRMRRIRRRDTDVERALRSSLHRRGLRFRLHLPIPGVPRVRPDVVFTRAKVAVFVDGCFWHRCPIHGSQPRSNRAWWKSKLDANVARDRRHDAALAAQGWRVVRVWEHEDPDVVADRIEAIVREHDEHAV
jgi:DNA mismatch endonuclease, patch repair protein